MDEFYGLIPKSYTTKKRLNVIHDKCLVFRHGHIAITDYKMGDNPEFEKSLSVWNDTKWRYDRKAGYYVQTLKEFRVPRGYNLGMLANFFPGYRAYVDNDAYPADKIDIKLLAPPRDDEQRVGLSFLCCQGDFKKNSRFTTLMLDMDTGSGKAQPDDTMVPTPKGIRRLDSLKVGDKVFNLHGEPVKVLGVYPRGKQETYQVTLKDGRKTYCNPDHLWYVLDKHGTEKVLPLSEMIKDYRTVKYGHTINKYRVPMPGPVQYKYRDVPIDPYVLGVFIGNGCLGETALTLSSGNLYVPAEVSSIIGCSTNLRRYGNYSYQFNLPDDLQSGHKIKKVQTKEFFKDFPELIDSRSGDKHIPKLYKYNSVYVRRELLVGLMDTDGHISKHRYKMSYTTISPQLKDDVVEIVRSLGYGAYVSEDSRYDKYSTGHCYTIHITCPDKDKPLFFRANRKLRKIAIEATQYETRTKRDVMAIVDIKKVSPCKQRCIMVDDPLHLYITENYIPTHNTYTSVAATCFLQARAIVVMPYSVLLEQWRNSFLEFTSLTKDEVLIVKGSNQCLKILNGKYEDVKVFIFLIDTLSSFQSRYGDTALMDLLIATKAYLKIVDEVHRDIKAVSMLEGLSNFHMNYYMSATPDRANQKEKVIFRNCFKNVPRFGSGFKTKEEKHTNIIVKGYKFVPTAVQQKRMVHPRTKWLNSKAYEKELLHAPKEQSEDFFNAFGSMLKWSKGLLKKDNKILIMSETVNGTAITQAFAETFFPGETSRHYGALTDKEKTEAKKARIICATLSSLGTGADIAGVQHVYNITTYANDITAGQTAGRARKLKDGTPVFYIELVNFGYMKTLRQYEKRKPALIKKSRTGKIILID